MKITKLEELVNLAVYDATDVFIIEGSWHTNTEGLYKLTFLIGDDEYQTDCHKIEKLLNTMKKAEFNSVNIAFNQTIFQDE